MNVSRIYQCLTVLNKLDTESLSVIVKALNYISENRSGTNDNPSGSVHNKSAFNEDASARLAYAACEDDAPALSTCLRVHPYIKKTDTKMVSVFLAGAEGLEPSARGFGDRCSTN